MKAPVGNSASAEGGGRAALETDSGSLPIRAVPKFAAGEACDKACPGGGGSEIDRRGKAPPRL
ncbi:hypothetical protein, partial [uncultured Fretibacterium sp.]|uniref:hypothetical protein n=1 Tax=uncultured Fretibacterium sp. TaxID=1678694 RepID=UPI00262DA163